MGTLSFDAQRFPDGLIGVRPEIDFPDLDKFDVSGFQQRAFPFIPHKVSSPNRRGPQLDERTNIFSNTWSDGHVSTEQDLLGTMSHTPGNSG